MAGALGIHSLGNVMTGYVMGVALYYAGPTVTTWESAEKIEVVIRKNYVGRRGRRAVGRRGVVGGA